MTRHKSRVARRNRRSARRGTRKQSGGFFGELLKNWFKKTDATGVVPAAAQPVAAPVAEEKAAAEPDKGLLGIFNKDSKPVVPAANNSSSSQVGGRKKSRKTRHRRSPRRHRK